jgi:hypothetical protein
MCVSQQKKPQQPSHQNEFFGEVFVHAGSEVDRSAEAEGVQTQKIKCQLRRSAARDYSALDTRLRLGFVIQVFASLFSLRLPGS